MARSTGRKLVILPKDAHFMEAIYLADTGAPDPGTDPDLLIYPEFSSVPGKWAQEH